MLYNKCEHQFMIGEKDTWGCLFHKISCNPPECHNVCNHYNPTGDWESKSVKKAIIHKMKKDGSYVVTVYYDDNTIAVRQGGDTLHESIRLAEKLGASKDWIELK